MAWSDNKWLSRPEREARIDRLTQHMTRLRALYDTGKATAEHVRTLFSHRDEVTRLQRINRAENDVAYFAYIYLSDSHNADNDANIIRHAPGKLHDGIDDMAQLHREFFDLCDNVNVTQDARIAIASPRGHNKSGTFSNILPLHQIAFRKRKYILVISETDAISKKLTGWVNGQLKFNEMLRNDFGPLLHPVSTKNEKDNEEAFLTTTGTLVEASSSGKQLRGKRNGANRVDLCIIDDPSSLNNEGTREAREKLIHWFNSVVMPIGQVNTAFIVVGTLVTPDGLLKHVLDRKDFQRSLYGAITSDPDNAGLWDRYCEVYAKGDDMTEADAFYEENKAELECGSEVAWPWRWSYRELMHERVNMGARAFNSEYRNVAYSEEDRLFFPDRFGYYHYENEHGRKVIVYEGERIPVDSLTVSGAWDLAMGHNSRSCLNSVVTVGRHERTGRIFVLDEYSSKEAPHVFMNIVIDKIRTFRHNAFSIESINAYHEFYRQLAERLRIERMYKTRLHPVKSHKTSKSQRIESLEPLVHNKTLIFSRSHTTLIGQLEEYPDGVLIDAADALQMAVENVSKPKRTLRDKPLWL
ncbi:hypothetical protein [Cohnella lupini]|uniref:Putative phage terminase large subunit-like protein n=1 Tax=Cohnella lupini TaxID=1294267 RepID=A0A3D9I7L9_9BACL|nr:hypothetical protein [Cohnella lupini]RED57166.1 putative phage terminase large subunit-like protein [Cohnella lupini]